MQQSNMKFGLRNRVQDSRARLLLRRSERETSAAFSLKGGYAEMLGFYKHL